MRKMPMCPMMMGQMPMMMGQMPMMPMGQMPNMQHDNMCMKAFEDDDRDEAYFAGMYGENCHKVRPYVVKVLDKMEEKDDMIFDEQLDRDMVENMIENAYNDMISDMPEMADESDVQRQYYGPRRIARDLLGLILINELLGRRRRRRRRHYDFDYGYGSGYPDYGYDDYYYYE